MSETEEKPGNWTIRAMPEESRKKALAAANRRGETAAQFMVRAIDLTVANDAGDRIEMPSLKPSNKPTNSEIEPTNIPAERVDPAAMAALIHAVSEAARNADLPKGAKEQATVFLNYALRQARGLPPKKIGTRPAPIVGRPSEPAVVEHKDLPRLSDVAS